MVQKLPLAMHISHVRIVWVFFFFIVSWIISRADYPHETITQVKQGKKEIITNRPKSIIIFLSLLISEENKAGRICFMPRKVVKIGWKCSDFNTQDVVGYFILD